MPLYKNINGIINEYNSEIESPGTVYRYSDRGSGVGGGISVGLVKARAGIFSGERKYDYTNNVHEVHTAGINVKVGPITLGPSYTYDKNRNTGAVNESSSLLFDYEAGNMSGNASVNNSSQVELGVAAYVNGLGGSENIGVDLNKLKEDAEQRRRELMEKYYYYTKR